MTNEGIMDQAPRARAGTADVMRIRAEEKIAEIGDSVGVCKCGYTRRPCVACQQWCGVSELLSDLLAERADLLAALKEHIACAQNEGWYVYRGTDERRGGFAELEAAIDRAEGRAGR